MPSYVEKALKRFQHLPPLVPQDQPHQHTKKTYGAKVQHANLPDDPPPLDKTEKNSLRRPWGYFFIPVQAVDLRMLTALSTLASKQVAPTEKKMQKCLQFLDYAASEEDAIVTYQASNMRLAIHSDTLCLSWGWPHVNGSNRGHPHQLWSSTQYFADNKSSDVISRRGQAGCIVHQCQNGSLNSMHTWGKGAHTNLHPNPNQQFNCTGTTHQQNSAKGVEDHGHAISLVALPRSAGQVSILLETWNTKYGRLLDQASSIQPPQSFLATNPNVYHIWSCEHQIEYSKKHCNQVLCQEHSIDTIICGTIGSKAKNSCSHRCLTAWRQGCVRLAVSPS